MFKCEDCHTDFPKKQFLEVHKKTARKFCLEYKNIIFICLKCNLKFKGIRNLNLHKEECNSLGNYESLYLGDDKEIDILLEKVSSLEKQVDKLKNLEMELNIEKLKNKIYSQIIVQKVGIKLEDVIEKKDDGIHVYDTEKGGNISLYIHEYIKKENLSNVFDCKKEEKIINKEEEIKPKKQQYRTIKIGLDEHKQSPFIMSDDNFIIEKSPYIVYDEGEYDDIDKEKNKAKIKDCFEMLKTSRTYNKILENIKKLRNGILAITPINEYLEMLKTHIDIITEILKSKDCKKLNSLVSKSLSYIDMRLVFYNDFDKYQIDTDDIQKLKKCLNLSASNFNNFDVFNMSKFCENFYNYSVVLFTIKENISRFLINNNGFFNLIYVPLPNNDEIDPYSFYTLEKVTKKNREWNMDCRLETFSNNFIHNVRQYMIDIFKKIYYEVFHDNVYRSEHDNKTQIIDCDCEQLINNILTLSDPILFSKILRMIVKEYSIYIPTENDKFNLRNDDKLQKKKYENYKQNQDDILNVIKSMFDGMKTEDALDFYRKKFKNVF